MAKILVVDDEKRIRSILHLMLESKDHRVFEAQDGLEALESINRNHPDLVITDIRMDRLDGKELLIEIKKQGIACPVIFITAYASFESVVEALRNGAVDYLAKPFEEDQVHLAVERALGIGEILSENVKLKTAIETMDSREEGIFASSAMDRVKDMAARVAQTEATVLVTGDSGTGKEVVAKLVHDKSSRAGERFVCVNCAAISDNLVESELFGHEKGSFTGADKRKIGKFEYADRGTLFLDEVGDLPFEAQAKLLRVIQEKQFSRVGGNEDIKVNTRLICATNKNLENLVAEKKFREDLYYRLAVFPISVPPLRERKDDIIPLAEFFIKKHGKQIDVSAPVITPGARKRLMAYPWPGNVRELSNAVERAMILKGGGLPVTSDDLNFITINAKEEIHGNDEFLFKLPPTGIDYDEVQRDIVNQALNLTANNQSAAARFLGLSRARFRTLLKLLE